MLLRSSDRFRKVARLVHIVSADDGQVVAQQLERDDVDDGLEGVHRLGDLRDWSGGQIES